MTHLAYVARYSHQTVFPGGVPAMTRFEYLVFVEAINDIVKRENGGAK